MLLAWTRYGQSGAQGTAQDTRTLSLDVLAATGFRKSYKFHSSTEPSSDANTARDYRKSLNRHGQLDFHDGGSTQAAVISPGPREMGTHWAGDERLQTIHDGRVQ